MKRTCAMAGLVLAALMAYAGSAHAAAYGIYEQGAAVMGMGGAGVATVHDASALFYNPANLTSLDGLQLYAGGSLLQPHISFAGQNPYPGYGVTEEMEKQSFFPPTVYVTKRVNKQWAMGGGINTPFGLGVSWKNPDTFTGRYIVTKAELQTLNGTYAVAFKANDAFSVGVGFDALLAKVELNQRELVPGIGGGGQQVDVAKTQLKSDFTPDVGWNASIAWKPDPKLRVGVYYRSKIVVDVTGKGTFQQILTGDTTLDKNVAKQLPPNQDVRTILRFPALMALAAAYDLPNRLLLEADITGAQWSVFEDLPLYFQTTPSASTKIVENYNDALGVRLGLQQVRDAFTWRIGWYYEDAAAPQESMSPLLPDAIRNGYTIGFGKNFGPNQDWALDVYELAVVAHGRGTGGVNRDGYDGQYKTYVNLLGLGLTKRW